MQIRTILFFVSAMMISPAQGAPVANIAADQAANRPCSLSEKWEHEGKWVAVYNDYAAGKTSTLYGFSEALNLKRLSQIMSKADFERDFSEYWVGRVLFDLKLDFVAYQAFQSVFENTEQPQIKKAALVCLAEIQKRTPDLKVPASVHSSIVTNDADKRDLADALFLSLFQNLGKNFSQKLAAQLPDAHQNLILGIDASQRKKFSEAIPYLAKFVQSLDAKGPFLKNYLDQARLLLARAYYSTGKFPEAEIQFQSVTKTSNLVIDAMSDLSWAYLQSNRFDDVLGIAMQLRVGALRNTFAPEAPMVAAMALNERCLFPESVKMINGFAHDYAPAHDWLAAHEKGVDVYAEILKLLKKAPTEKATVPAKVSSEWLKSPAFLTRQVELNALISHPAQLARLQEKGLAEQVKMTDATINELATFVTDVKKAQLKLKNGEDLPDEYGARYIVLKKKLRKLARFYKSSKTWKALSKNYEKRIPGIRTKLVAKVNEELNHQNERMLTQLSEIQENTELIEIEIYNGASHDMIWRNAHPDYEEITKSVSDDKETPQAGAVWSWGRYVASELEEAEVWEDEVGALKADVTDQCNKKEKYVSLKMKRKR